MSVIYSKGGCHQKQFYLLQLFQNVAEGDFADISHSGQGRAWKEEAS